MPPRRCANVTMAPEGRSRVVWADLPDGVADLITARLGEQVAGGHSQDGGYGPGRASTLGTESGERVFVKAVGESLNAYAVELYRREAAVVAHLGEHVPAPAFRWRAEAHLDGQDWVALAFDAADAPGPGRPWTPAGVAGAMDLADRIGDLEAPEGLHELAEEPFGYWHDVVADPQLRAGVAALDPWAAEHVELLAALGEGWAEAVAGGALQHGDLRADNMVTLTGALAAVD